ncbi:unnamed protein product, partial [Mesorhabditis belari]|uniref:Uncharacterized protein n=1 Tax=Mesorhabditis belari TaxID=2138241 RepID=A0AAF3FAH8_9BILA
MHSGTATTSNGYAKYQIRSSGIGRVLAEESTVFSIDDHEENEGRSMGNQQPNESTEKSRLVECRLDSDEEDEEEEKITTISPQKNEEERKRQTKNATQNSVREKEFSRLTDEFDVEGDSASDELDLLPPLGATPHSVSKLWKVFNCCRSRVPLKCSIL